MSIQYYLIHGGDTTRAQRYIDQFKHVGIDNSNVKWILHPNKDEMSDDFLKTILNQKESTCCFETIPAGVYPHIKKGAISCTYKHYLCLKDIVENNYDYGIIMEDNSTILENVPNKISLYISQLNLLYPDWDILFDYKLGSYNEMPITKDINVYPKSNIYYPHWAGATRACTFYLVNYKCAKKLYENFLPFNHAPCRYYNDLFRKLNIKSFYAIPENVVPCNHISTSVTD